LPYRPPVALGWDSGLLSNAKCNMRWGTPSLFRDRVKLVFSVFVASLVPCLSLTEKALSRENMSYEADPVREERYLDGAANELAFSAYPDQAWYFKEGVGTLRSERVPFRPLDGSGPYISRAPDSRSAPGSVPSAGYSPYPSPSERAGHPWRPSFAPAQPDAPAVGYSTQSGAFRGSPYLGASEYRFRDDVPTEVGRRDLGTLSPQYGYRFRPWTEQEQRRMDAQVRWRPADLFRQQPAIRGPSPDQGTYGYQTGGWVDPYWGTRR
jgi:hypothetical protein